jgi:formamidopyrimidine-DNA glycosylase
MVEAPRIRITYEKVAITKDRRILSAEGVSYKKIGIDLTDFFIRKWWYAGKYLYTYLILGEMEYVIRTHMMMYGRINLNDDRPRTFMKLTLDNGDTLSWYWSQIKILDPNCRTDLVKSNYDDTCSSYQIINDSVEMMKYDVSNPDFQPNILFDHIKRHLSGLGNIIITDLLLDQKYFPGVGNILQQETLYRCKILPTHKVASLTDEMINCLIVELVNIVTLLYQKYYHRTDDSILQIYHHNKCPLGHATITRYLGYHNRRTTWCPICQI